MMYKSWGAHGADDRYSLQKGDMIPTRFIMHEPFRIHKGTSALPYIYGRDW